MILRNAGKKVVEFDFRTATPEVRTTLMKAIPEVYNRENALAAITACEQLHIPLDVSLKAIQHFSNVSGRMEEIKNAAGIRVVVDFAHTPNALEQALSSLRASLKKGQRLIAVFGAAGLRDHAKRPMMGRIASELADEAVFTAEDPRTEDVNVIIRQMKEGVVKNWGHMHEIADRREAIRFAITKLARPGDVVGIFGKGHERSLNLDGKHEIPWSDQDEAKKSLEFRIQ
jgi:UDP-N-acetylmuramoyl-L-alanyl-D-glutamate--2,6-diaminopimelate ligase